MEARFSILCERFSLAAINDFSPGMLLGLILKEGVGVVAGTKIPNIYQYPDQSDLHAELFRDEAAGVNQDGGFANVGFLV